MKKKLLSVLAIALLTGISLTGCNEDNPSEVSSSNPTSQVSSSNGGGV